jgi:N-acetylmuramoyl-L-alanine amidase
MAFRSRPPPDRLLPAVALLALTVLAGCRTPPAAPPPAADTGDTIIVAGRRFPAGTRVVTWRDPAGYDAYAVQPAIHGRRPLGRAVPADRAPTLAELQKHVDRLVIHYDAAGLSRICFEVLKQRRLSAHFLLDVDGTVYQILDLQERAWHAGASNDRAIGIEIANLGAYAPADAKTLAAWYRLGPAGQTRLVPPAAAGDPRLLYPGAGLRPQRPEPVKGRIHGRDLVQYDFTPGQYAALIKLTAALHRVFPRIRLDCPRDAAGRVLTTRLPEDQLATFRGVLGHHHLQTDKLDPGPAFQWDAVLNGAKRELEQQKP